MADILCVIEQRGGAVRKGANELLTAARQLADQLGGRVDALVCGAGAVSGIESLGAAGADRVLTASHEAFAQYAPEAIVATVQSASRISEPSLRHFPMPGRAATMLRSPACRPAVLPSSFS